MTPKEIGKLTLADIEAIASRFEAAAKTIREAQSLLGGGVASAPAVAPPAVRHIRGPTTKGVQLTDEELAEREAFVAMNRGPSTSEPEFPPSIAAALGGT